jgi:hypothetical protein
MRERSLALPGCQPDQIRDLAQGHTQVAAWVNADDTSVMQMAMSMLTLKDSVADLSQAAVSRHNTSLSRCGQWRA